MALNGKKNSITITTFRSTSRITTSSFISVENGTTYFTPALTSRSQTIGDYVYYASDPTICAKKNNTIYYAAKDREVVYDIPAGTYSPSVFESLVSNYVSQNSHREILFGNFTITVNNQNIFLPSGSYPYDHTYIGYYTQTNGSSISGDFRYIQFSPTADIPSDSKLSLEILDINFRGLYVVYSSETFNNYTNYPITISRGIKFV